MITSVVSTVYLRILKLKSAGGVSPLVRVMNAMCGLITTETRLIVGYNAPNSRDRLSEKKEKLLLNSIRLVHVGELSLKTIFLSVRVHTEFFINNHG